MTTVSLGLQPLNSLDLETGKMGILLALMTSFFSAVTALVIPRSRWVQIDPRRLDLSEKDP